MLKLKSVIMFETIDPRFTFCNNFKMVRMEENRAERDGARQRRQVYSGTRRAWILERVVFMVTLCPEGRLCAS